MEAGVDNPVHVEVQVVVFDVVGVGLAGVNGDGDSIDDNRLFLNDVDHHHRVLLGQPFIEGRDSHGENLRGQKL